MTVGELIRQLESLPHDWLVLVYETGGEGCANGYKDASVLHQIRVAPRSTNGFYPRFFKLPDRNTVAAIILE
jgi:hypothetical protein